MRNEPPVVIEHPEEAAELLECFGHRKVFNLADFHRGRVDALIINDVAQDFYLTNALGTCFGLEITPQSGKRFNRILRCCSCSSASFKAVRISSS